MYKKNKKRINNQEAFVSMMALMLANIFLIIGLSIFNIALRESLLSSGSRESLFAFYAADGGMECALYWDIQQHSFSTSTSPASINCSNQDAVIAYSTEDCGGGACRKNTFNLAFPQDSSGACAYIEIIKESDGDTIIRASGRNTCDVNNARRVERTWRVRY